VPPGTHLFTHPFTRHPLTRMDLLTETLKNPFTWGLLLGLLVTAFILKSGFTARRHAARELKRVLAEMKDLQSHLNTQLKINASGNESLQTELESLKRQNEALRVNNAALQQKPGRAEQRLLQIHEIAIRAMREQAPGFAPAWEKALRQGEAEVEAAESGLRKLVRRVLPGLGNAPSSQTAVIVGEDPAGNV
jgi:DNA anti-recombination protein RmuC